jgi:hypothetical protein
VTKTGVVHLEVFAEFDQLRPSLAPHRQQSTLTSERRLEPPDLGSTFITGGRMQFDWVKGRKACSAPELFILLKDVVERDVASIQGHGDAKFELQTTHETRFVVTKTRSVNGSDESEGIAFELMAGDGHIRVQHAHDDERLFIAVPHLTHEQLCKLVIRDLAADLSAQLPDADSLELWQVSRLALEKLFFDR